ncbi:flagellar biosynthesis anti-sigma factor FlgM [Butyrivibrio sp. NC3005]|jgi:negative regulator of flagellin synthesis FlgM|uniref:flagellar biosynthesis anti-sigma factor FlgM n=1 Tax=Butyrivibrio sp. NC3005 TaxID=1280685 RepID=UPI00040797F8|nr:flagellar biosynthesis anti-sigma factor FlgM [Butyrivibrio sp. NC3005]
MRIEAYNQVQQIYNASSKKHVGASEKISKVDGFQMSSIGKDIQVAKQAVANAPDIREDVVARLREKVQNGTYDIDNDKFADKLLSKL